MSIDTSKIKAGDRVQIANGDWFEVAIVTKTRVFIETEHCAGSIEKLITAHRPASEPEPVLERDPMCDAEWEHLLKTAQRGRNMEVGGLKMQLVEANALLRQWRKLYDLGIEDFMPSFAHPVVGELYDRTMEYLTDEQPENLKPNITMEELEATNKAVEELTKPQSEKAPEVSDMEWVTLEDWCELDPPNTDQDQAASINALLTRKLAEGKLPVVSKADVAEAIWGSMCEPPHYVEKRLKQLGITPDLLEGGAE